MLFITLSENKISFPNQASKVTMICLYHKPWIIISNFTTYCSTVNCKNTMNIRYNILNILVSWFLFTLNHPSWSLYKGRINQSYLSIWGKRSCNFIPKFLFFSVFKVKKQHTKRNKNNWKPILTYKLKHHSPPYFVFVSRKYTKSSINTDSAYDSIKT